MVVPLTVEAAYSHTSAAYLVPVVARPSLCGDRYFDTKSVGAPQRMVLRYCWHFVTGTCFYTVANFRTAHCMIFSNLIRFGRQVRLSVFS